MYCAKCGNLNNDTDNWCTRCGHRIGAVEVEAEIPKQEVIEPPVVKQAEIKKTDEIKDYFGRSVASALFGSVSFGAAAVIFSGMTRTELASGDLVRAERYSKKARNCRSISFAIALVKIVCVLAFFVTSATMSIFSYFS